MESIDIAVESIRIVAFKREQDRFEFENKGKRGDGFVLFTEGVGSYFDGTGREYAVSAGTLVLLRDGARYRFSCGPCAYVTAAFFFSPVSDPCLASLPPILSCPGFLREKILDLQSAWQAQRDDSRTVCRMGLMRLYLDLLRWERAQETPDAGGRLVSRATEYLHENFKRNFSAEEISAYCNVSPSHLRAVYVARTGQTLVSARNALRITAAKEMLGSGMFSVKETASELGYCDVFYFSRCFTSAVGRSPARFAAESQS